MAEKKTAPANGKTYGITLVDATNAQLRFSAEQKKDGKVITYAFHRLRGEKGKTIPGGQGRGATQVHDSMDAAKKVVDAAVAGAVKAGWQRRMAGGGGARPDAFDMKSIPAPKTVKA